MQPAFPAAVIAAACADAKAYLRDTSDVNDARIEAMAASALALAEAFTGQVLVARDDEEMLTVRQNWTPLSSEPVTAITGVIGVPAEGANFVLPVGAYSVDIDARGMGWVRIVRAGTAGRVRVLFTAGLANDWTALPAPVRQGVILLIAHLADERSASEAPPAAVTALWRPWRRIRLVDAAEFRAVAEG
ncbi:hypothetical protein KY084_06795 [Stakelama sp. CBK3Z-3]|uniref:PhiE125 gp8 family phage protein n=1 Tax=Stakelama flava TaxID=2860338 RepID=A0ABS6XK58_9SPHN|nr:hypothetical protein [Stakelama flava]MBW4330582.1 hypothetical protein [Stakelama flava]